MMMGLLGMSYFSSPAVIIINSSSHRNTTNTMIATDGTNHMMVSTSSPSVRPDNNDVVPLDPNENEDDENHLDPDSNYSNKNYCDNLPNNKLSLEEEHNHKVNGTCSAMNHQYPIHRHESDDDENDDPNGGNNNNNNNSPLHHLHGENNEIHSRTKNSMQTPTRYMHLSFTDDYSSHSYNNNNNSSSSTTTNDNNIEDSPIIYYPHHRKCHSTCFPCCMNPPLLYRRSIQNHPPNYANPNDDTSNEVDGMTLCCCGRCSFTKRQLGMLAAAFCGLYGGSILAPMKFATTNLKGTHCLFSFAI
jgi:hypothetical protein